MKKPNKPKVVKTEPKDRNSASEVAVTLETTPRTVINHSRKLGLNLLKWRSGLYIREQDVVMIAESILEGKRRRNGASQPGTPKYGLECQVLEQRAIKLKQDIQIASSNLRNAVMQEAANVLGSILAKIRSEFVDRVVNQWPVKLQGLPAPELAKILRREVNVLFRETEDIPAKLGIK